MLSNHNLLTKDQENGTPRKIKVMKLFQEKSSKAIKFLLTIIKNGSKELPI